MSSTATSRFTAYDAVRAWGVDEPGWVYCSGSSGNDANSGTTRAQSVATPQRAREVALALGIKRIVVDGAGAQDPLEQPGRIYASSGIVARVGGLNGPSSASLGGVFGTLPVHMGGRGTPLMRRTGIGAAGVTGLNNAAAVQAFQDDLANFALVGVDAEHAGTPADAAELQHVVSIAAHFDTFDNVLFEDVRCRHGRMWIGGRPGRERSRDVRMRRLTIDGLANVGFGVGETQVGLGLDMQSGLDGLDIVDLVISAGDKDTGDSGNHGIYAIGCDGARIAGALIDRSGGYAIKMRRSSGVVEDVMVARGNLGVELNSDRPADDDAPVAAACTARRIVMMEPTGRVYQTTDDVALGRVALGWGVTVGSTSGLVRVQQVLCANGGPARVQQGRTVQIGRATGRVELSRILAHHFMIGAEEGSGEVSPLANVEFASPTIAFDRCGIHSGEARLCLAYARGVADPVYQSTGGLGGRYLLSTPMSVVARRKDGAGVITDRDRAAWLALTGEEIPAVAAEVPAETLYPALIAGRLGLANWGAVLAAAVDRARVDPTIGASRMVSIALADAGLADEPDRSMLERAGEARRGRARGRAVAP
jgi:hypothetical protein